MKNNQTGQQAANFMCFALIPDFHAILRNISKKPHIREFILSLAELFPATTTPGRPVLAVFIVLMGLTVGTAQANNNVSDTPLFVTPNVSPLVLLSMSNDHQLYFEAYPEFADLNDDGEVNATYSHDIDYYGYFDSYKCYSYSTTDDRFVPKGATADKYCSSVEDADWSGNFLNWVSMARIDVVRKILYGGYRSVDTATTTVLERTYLPMDAHAWARYYDKADINLLTPFPHHTSETTETTDSDDNTIEIGTGEKTFITKDFTTDIVLQRGDQVVIKAIGSNTANNTMWGVVQSSAVSGGSVTVDVSRFEGSGTYSTWSLENVSRAGISFCNVTYAGTGKSQEIDADPLIRVARGNYALWDSNERFQCNWREEESSSSRINFNDIGVTTLGANDRNPRRNVVGLGELDYAARVEVCQFDLLGGESCKQYPNGSHKPIGLLQEYGDNNAINFGLLTGSNLMNKSGGVLRKNIGSMNDEVNVDTDGTFATPDADVGSIIRSLDLLRVYGYDHSDGRYNVTDNCPWGMSDFDDGECTGWGNPQSEIFLEAVRYFANSPGPGESGSNLQATADYTFSSENDRLEGLGKVEWQPPITEAAWCASPTHVNFNSSVASYDAETLGSATDLPGIDSVSANAADTDNPSSVYGWTNAVGEGEGLHGENWFIGETGSLIDGLCTSKTLGSLAEARGLCPESPRLGGSYMAAGLAHYAYTNDLRPDLDRSTYGEQFMTTYAVAMAPAVPQINIPLPGGSETRVRLLPACYNTNTEGACAIVDFKVLSQDVANGTGSFLVNWEDSEQGGDYDMDMIGILSYEINNNNITVTTRTTADTSSQAMGFGYILSGTDGDGFHVTSGINDFDYTPPGNGYGCTKCNLLDDAEPRTYNLSTSGIANLLESPMFYAAKWGGFDKSLDFPADNASWDTNGNGTPDNYYFAINPERLAEDLRNVFSDIIATSNSATSIATNSSRLDTDTTIFQAMFDSGEWFGDLLAYELINSQLKWNAAEKLADLANYQRRERNILTTYDGFVEYLRNTTPNALNYSGSGVNDGLATDRIRWLHGVSHPDLRQREHNGEERLLGDIVGSDPAFVGKPNFGYAQLPGVEGSSYTQHRFNIQGRTDAVYVGANDGMLHGFDEETGEELMAYMPGELLSSVVGADHAPLSTLTDPDYQHRYYVDGTPTVRDAYIDHDNNGTPKWRTVLVGTMGAGGRTVFALDVTDPDNIGINNVLWEFTHDELGLGVTEAEIVRLPSGEWVVAFGNGYDSASNESGLFLVDLNANDPTNTDSHVFISSGSGSAMQPNAMAPPFITDFGGPRRVANLGYAGDLLGNLWRIEFDASDWKDTNLNLLFETGNNQPITTKPVGQTNPESSDKFIVSFGTGSFFLTGDREDLSVQSIYGIIDSGSEVAIGNLLEQTIIWQGAATFSDPDDNDITFDNLRATSNESLDGAPGWRLDLVYESNFEGERVVSRPSLAPGVDRNAVRYTTLIPDTDPCGVGRRGYLMELDIVSGSRPRGPVFDLDGDGLFDDSDLVEVDGERIPVSGVGGVTQGEQLSTVEDSQGVETIVQPLDPDSDDDDPSPGLLGDGTSSGRQSWEQVR